MASPKPRPTLEAFVQSLEVTFSLKALKPDSKLISDRVIDSMQVPELLEWLDRKYGVEIPLGRITTCDLETPQAIWDALPLWLR